jgi:hypothetical protein
MKTKTRIIPAYLNTFQRAHQVPVSIGGKNKALILSFSDFFQETHQISYNLSEESLDVKFFAKNDSKDGALLVSAKVLQVKTHHKRIKKNNITFLINFICLCFSIIKSDYYFKKKSN